MYIQIAISPNITKGFMRAAGIEPTHFGKMSDGTTNLFLYKDVPCEWESYIVNFLRGKPCELYNCYLREGHDCTFLGLPNYSMQKAIIEFAKEKNFKII